MCDKAVDPCLPTLKFVPVWFVTNKMLEKLDNILFSNDDKDLDDIDSDIVTFCCNSMGLVTINFNNFNLKNDNFDEDDPETIVLARFIAGVIDMSKIKHMK